jgi:hypothetical protein
MNQLIIVAGFLVVLSLPLMGQNWETVNVDSFYISEKEIFISAISNFGLALLDTSFENVRFKKEVEIEGIVWLPDKKNNQSETFLVFGVDSARKNRLWGVGYSQKDKKISFGKISLDILNNTIHIKYQKIEQKNIDIIPPKNRLSYKILFFAQSNEMEVRINGVPLKTTKSVPLKTVKRLGYLVRGENLGVERPVVRVR